LAVLCFYSKQVFGPRTDKSQPIWIKLLYGIHLWADLYRDRRSGPSWPNQNNYVFVRLVTHPCPRDGGSPRFRRKTVKVEVRTGAIVKNSGIL